MRNLETPVCKYGVYGATSSLGSALLHELLARQHEVVALVDDLNVFAARPGLRARRANPCDAASVGEGAAGCDALVYLHPRRAQGEPHSLYEVFDGLLAGLPPIRLNRLLVVADFAALEADPSVQAALQRLALHPLRWTLVDCPPSGFDLSLDDFQRAPLDARRRTLLRIAAGIADELARPQHLHERIHFKLD